MTRTPGTMRWLGCRRPPEYAADEIQAVCERLLPDAAPLTTGELAARIKKLAIALDPEWAARRYASAVQDRDVIGTWTSPLGRTYHARRQPITTDLPGPLLPARLLKTSGCQLVGALVLRVSGVALDPVPLHLMPVHGSVQALPQVGVLDRLLAGGLPAVALPSR